MYFKFKIRFSTSINPFALDKRSRGLLYIFLLYIFYTVLLGVFNGNAIWKILL